MRHPITTLLFFLLASSLFAQQDTITVRTFTFDSITTRRSTFLFPDTTHHYRKVLMLHTLKCDPATTQDNYACGEWDYLTYHKIYEHSGLLDSTAHSHPYYQVNALNPDSTALSYDPLFDHYQHYRTFRVVDAVNSETDHASGQGDASDAASLDASSGSARTQFIIGESELSGLSHVDAIRLFAEQAGTSLDRMTIRMKNVPAGMLNSFDNNGLTTVFDQPYQFIAGMNTLTLTQAFAWAGTGNAILVDIAVEAANVGSAPVLTATQTTDNVLHAKYEASILMNDGRIGVNPAVFASVSDQITISFRVFGGAALPVNNSILEALNAQGNRVLNIHLPWGNSSVYWDAGADGIGGYDRISKAAIPAEIKGQWNYWTFTKNATTGVMKIYLNGAVWQTGSGFTHPMSGITTFNIGANGTATNPYPGQIDEFNVFNTELDQATIQAWMNKSIDATHPDYADLVLGLPFDENEGVFTATNMASNGLPAFLLGHVQHIPTAATALGESTTIGTIRPDLTLVEADYSSHLDSVLVTEDRIHEGICLETFALNGTALVISDTLRGWEAGVETTYAPDGTVASTNIVTAPWIVNTPLTYYTHGPEILAVHEIGRYITPYGINLSLGPNGFTWVYDVTDYQYLLHDSVDISAGNQQELIDLQFLMIEGTPGRKVVNVVNPWGPEASFTYGNLSNNINLSAVTIPLSPNASQWAMRSRITGHADASSVSGAQGCCEFKDNTHSLLSNGSTVDSWHIWQTNDCALNPVYPQGGTWIYSREGWCPGDIVKERTTELTSYVSNNSLNIDYGITPVPANNPGMAAGNYVMSMELFEFSAPTHQLDAEIYDVLRPSDDGYRTRENPICYDPVVVLRNAGGTTLTSVTFTYGVSGGTDETYTWTGSLAHMARTNVTLPIPDGNFWTGDNANKFHVSVSAPNGGADQYADNNAYSTHFSLPVIYDNDILLNYKSNNNPQDNTVTVKDISGNVVFTRSNMAANTTYNDTLHLGLGCFTLTVLDNGNDGLSFWANTAQGTGFFRIKKSNGLLLKTFNPDFGRLINYPFAIGTVSNVDEIAVRPGFNAMPNPSDGRFTLETSNITGEVELTVIDGMGRVVRTMNPVLRGGNISLDLSDLDNGPYIIRLVTPDGVAVQRVVKQ